MSTFLYSVFFSKWVTTSDCLKLILVITNISFCNVLLNQTLSLTAECGIIHLFLITNAIH